MRTAPNISKSSYANRRLILEAADNKMDMLERLLDSAGPRSLQNTLIYATDKHPDQLDSVNALPAASGSTLSPAYGGRDPRQEDDAQNPEVLPIRGFACPHS